MRQQKMIRIVAIVVVAALVVTTLFAGVGSLFLG
ncbi:MULTISPECIES: stressosome-associated protein Prli42 [Paenibacillus]|nr:MULTISPECIES: stressosome-associated protein Prli42 [Paenibacillus]